MSWSFTGAPPNEGYHADPLDALDLFLLTFPMYQCTVSVANSTGGIRGQDSASIHVTSECCALLYNPLLSSLPP